MAPKITEMPASDTGSMGTVFEVTVAEESPKHRPLTYGPATATKTADSMVVSHVGVIQAVIRAAVADAGEAASYMAEAAGGFTEEADSAIPTRASTIAAANAAADVVADAVVTGNYSAACTAVA